jgi:hypothetical protein
VGNTSANARSKTEAVCRLRAKANCVTKRVLRKCRAVGGEETKYRFFHPRPRALGNRWRDFHIPAAPAITAMENGKSNGRVPTFPRLVSLSENQKRKETQSRLLPSFFRLLSGSSLDWKTLLALLRWRLNP